MTSELNKRDLLDLELHSGSIAKATVGQTTIGKIVKINDIDVADAKLSSADISQLFQTTNIEKIIVSADIELKSESELLDTSKKTVLKFLSIPDGELGIVVRSSGSDCREHINGLHVIETGRNVYNIEVGDTIVSCNDIPLGQLTSEAAVNIVKTTKERRLTIVKSVTPSNISTSGKNTSVESNSVRVDRATSSEDNKEESSGNCLVNSSESKHWKEIRKDYLFYSASKRLRSRTIETQEIRKDLEEYIPAAPICTSYAKELSKSFHLGNPRIFSETLERVKKDIQSS